MDNQKSYDNWQDWVLELIEHSRRTAKMWFAAWLITLVAFAATNAAWLYVYQSYDYVSQDGSGINNVNTGEQGDLMNGTESTIEEEQEEK